MAEADAPEDAFFEAEDIQSGRRRYLSISDVQASDGLQRSITDVRVPRWWDLYASTHTYDDMKLRIRLIVGQVKSALAQQ